MKNLIVTLMLHKKQFLICLEAPYNIDLRYIQYKILIDILFSLYIISVMANSYNSVKPLSQSFMQNEVDTISLHSILVCLASMGWQADFTFTYQLAKNNIDIHLIMKHHEWHGTLCEVTGFNKFYTIQDGNIEDVENKIKNDLIEFFGIAKELWDTYVNGVPLRIYNTPLTKNIHECFSGAGSYENDIFQDYKNGKRRVVSPCRMTPELALPGWSGCISMEDYILLGYNSNWFSDIIQKITVKQMHTICFFRLSLTTYNGNTPSAGYWNMSVFGFNHKYALRMKGGTETFFSERISIDELGGNTNTSSMIRTHFNFFYGIAEDIEKGLITNFIKPR